MHSRTLSARPTTGHDRARSRGTRTALRAPLLFLALVFGPAACDGPSLTHPLQDGIAGGVDATGDAGGDGDGGNIGDGSKGGGGGSASGYPNQPSGFFEVTETSFSSMTESGWTASSGARVVNDGSAPRSAGAVGEALFPRGWTGGSAPIWSEKDITAEGVRKLYVSFWLKLSDNWQGHPANDKVGYLWTHQKPVVFPSYVGGGSGPLHAEVRLQEVPDGARNLTPNLSNPEVKRGEWHHWEVLVFSNSGDAADGQVHWWLDGEKVGEYRDIRFATSGQSKIWNVVSWRPVWGGQGSEIRQDQRMWMDHIYVSGAR